MYSFSYNLLNNLNSLIKLRDFPDIVLLLLFIFCDYNVIGLHNICYVGNLFRHYSHSVHSMSTSIITVHQTFELNNAINRNFKVQTTHLIMDYGYAYKHNNIMFLSRVVCMYTLGAIYILLQCTLLSVSRALFTHTRMPTCTDTRTCTLA